MEIRKLNTLRGIAALIVVLAHFSNATDWLNDLPGFGAGQIGVRLFFILSGFLMSYLYMDKAFRKNEVGNFALARIARVVPLFVVVVLASYFMHAIGLKGLLYEIPDLASLASHLTLLYGESVLWTIPAEIHFYALFVLLWGLYTLRRRLLYVTVATSMVVLTLLNFPRPAGNMFGLPYDFAIVPALPYFIVGVLFGRLYLGWQAPRFLSRDIFVLGFILPVLFLYPKIFIFFTGHRHHDWQDLRVWFILSFAVFIFIFLVPDTSRLLANRGGDFLGKISYSLYLLHLPVLKLLEKPASRQPELYLVIFLTLSILIAYASYSLIEAPSRQAIRALAVHAPKPPNAPLASLDVSR